MKAEDNAVYEALRRNIARTRDERGYTQSQMSRALKMPQSTYASYEQGLRKFPLHVVVRISEILGVSADYLIFNG